MLPMIGMGRMGYAHEGSEACGEGEGRAARGMGRVGSYGPNIPPRKIAAIHTHVTL
jgi:hypothetical protein